MIVDWLTVGWVKASNIRMDILAILTKTPMTPKDLSKTIDVHLPQISTALGHMAKKGLVTCLNEGTRKGKLYQATTLGQDVADAIKSIDEQIR